MPLTRSAIASSFGLAPLPAACLGQNIFDAGRLFLGLASRCERAPRPRYSCL